MSPRRAAGTTDDRGLSIVRALIAAQNSFPPTPARLQRPATVEDYNATNSTAMVRVSGDTSPVEAAVLGGAASVGSRVMVSFEKPRGIFIGAGGGGTGVGPPGPPGAPGAPGAPGLNGSTVLNGNGPPSGGVGANGDFYIDDVAHAIYGPKTGGVWGSGTSLIGPSAPANRTFAFFTP